MWVCIAGRQRNIQEDWERTRLELYITAKFGNSNPKDFPRSPHIFMPFEWDSETPTTDGAAIRKQWEENQIILKEAEEKARLKKLQNPPKLK